MFEDKKLHIALLIVAATIVGIRSIYEARHPLILHGDEARRIAIPSTGSDIRSPVSFLFGRAPYFIVCDRARDTYQAFPNKFVDAQHAAGLRSSRVIADMRVDAVCGNNVGFEPFNVFQDANIEVYTGIKETVWDTLQAFPDALTRLTEQNVPAHFGITGSKNAVACRSFNAEANLARVVQGQYLICFACNYRTAKNPKETASSRVCPKCGQPLHEVLAVTGTKGNLKPTLRVF